jgi:hypothetical protein
VKLDEEQKFFTEAAALKYFFDCIFFVPFVCFCSTLHLEYITKEPENSQNRRRHDP